VLTRVPRLHDRKTTNPEPPPRLTRKETHTVKNLIRLKDSRAVRMAASAVAVAAVIAGATGTVAGQGNAAPTAKADNAPTKNAKFKHAKLKRGLLKIKGTRASDAIALD
jgi:hypothetical protein